MNAQEYTGDATAFSYYAEPSVSSVRFDRGPTSGGTSVAVQGSSFRGGSAYRCRFGVRVVDATYAADHDELHCVSPSSGAGNVSIEISLNGQQFTTSDIGFEYYTEANVSHVIPSAGPRQGGTFVTLVGAGFGAGMDYRCRFEGAASLAVVPATVESDATMRCLTPAARCGPSHL